MFLHLLPEIQKIVLSYCSVESLKNLALMNTECMEILREYLMHTVRITEEMLDKSDFLTSRRLEEMRKKLKSTKVLRISIYRRCTPDIFYKTIAKLNHLEELDLCRSTNVIDYNVSSLCEGLQSLKILNLVYS